MSGGGGTSWKLRTYQTVSRYEAALARHAQWCRWVKVLTCPCITDTTNQPLADCPICKGRGELFSSPGPFLIIDEDAYPDYYGRINIQNGPFITGTPSVYQVINTQNNQYNEIALGTQPIGNGYIQLAFPWPSPSTKLFANYAFDQYTTVTNENSTVIRSCILQTTGTAFNYKGRTYYGDIANVISVFNSTKNEYYTVLNISQQYIYLTGMGSWSSGDTLQVSYTFMQPFQFVIHSVSPQRSWRDGFIADSSDAVIQSPYYYPIFANDLITALSMDVEGTEIIDPRINSGNNWDIIKSVYDVDTIYAIIDHSGKSYDPIASVMVLNRTELHWINPKPNVRYTVKFKYHPTFMGLPSMDTARSAENKKFVNRINAKLRDKMNNQVVF
jgi:hypothetical protein